MPDPRTKGRLKLIALAALFIGPLLVAMVLYYSGSSWRPSGLSANGVLLDTPLRLPETWPAAGGGDAIPLRDAWTLVYAGPGACAADCRAALAEMRQVRLSLGKDMDRVHRVWLVTAGAPAADFPAAEHAGLLIASGAPLAAPGEPGDIYVVDPLGNLMMRFPRDTGMAGMRKDLAKLLKVSRIG